MSLKNSFKNTGNEASQQPETMESLQETLKRELTLKRKDEETPNPEPVAESKQDVSKKPGKKTSEKSGCCILL